MDKSYENIVIPIFVINLKKRKDRLVNIKEQFNSKPEFDLNIIEACEHPIGAVGLWNSVVKIISSVIDNDDDVIIICEDDHTFTDFYNKNYLIQNILEAAEQGAELLSGGIGGFKNAVPITVNRYWIDSFWSTQFIVLYRPIFQKILNVNFSDNDTSDGILSELTSHKMVLYPFISIQRDFGYSDVTQSNNKTGTVADLFKNTDEILSIYKKVYEQYL